MKMRIVRGVQPELGEYELLALMEDEVPDECRCHACEEYNSPVAQILLERPNRFAPAYIEVLRICEHCIRRLAAEAAAACPPD